MPLSLSISTGITGQSWYQRGRDGKKIYIYIERGEKRAVEGVEEREREVVGKGG